MQTCTLALLTNGKLTGSKLHDLLSSICLGHCQQGCCRQTGDGTRDGALLGADALGALSKRLGSTLQVLVPAASARW